ncbi:MAG: NADH-quinone oxidoreductase subunit N [Actinobacteria bacterium]|nr:NADH-quinone oxidoreductase subunit N [Actinomycetota bacterium]
MIDKPSVDWFALSPVLALLGASGIALLGAVLMPRRVRGPFAATVVALGFAGALTAAALVYAFTDEATSIVADAVRRDRFAALAQMIVAGCGLLAVGISYGGRRGGRVEAGERSDRRTASGGPLFGQVADVTSEYYALLAAAGAGMAFLVSANNLMTLFLALEWFSIALYILCAIDVDRIASLEAGLKYLIIGSFGSGALLFGSALVYGATGELGFAEIARVQAAQGLADDPLLLAGLAMIITGLAFKASAAPFHMWTPDVYEGAPTPVTAFMSAATKATALLLMLRLLTTAFPEQEDLWTIAVAVIACASLAIGNLAALVQRNVKRMLAYSSISHAGFMLIPIAANNALGGRALLFYLIPYAAMSLGAFAVVAARERELGEPVTLDNLSGFGWERPLLGIAMWVFMLGFAGLPLTGGFWGKFLAFSAAQDRGWTWLVIAGVAATVVSLYYYLAVVRAMYMRSGAELQLSGTASSVAAGGSPPREALLSLSVVAALIVTVGTFFAVDPVTELARDAAASLPF